MKKIAYAALLIAVSLKAQTVPAGQDTAPAVQPQAPSPRVLRRESPASSDEALKRLRDLGYVTSAQMQALPVMPTHCAIPLLKIPVPDNNRFASRAIPASPSIDPKIVVAPLLPACPQTVVPSTIATPVPVAPVPAPAPDKK